MTATLDEVAALRCANAELQKRLNEAVEERDEALDQQTATGEVLQVINSSSGDLAPVFDAMLEKAMRLCEASFGELLTYDGASFITVAMRGVPAAFSQYRKNNINTPGPGSLGARVLEGHRVVHVLDLKREDAYQTGHPSRRAIVDIGGARTALIASLRKDDRVLGLIILFRQEVRAFSDKQIALLQNFAAQAVIAMENARLFGELRQRTSDLEESLEYQIATSDVLQVISRSTFDLQPVLDTLVETAARLCEADNAIIFRLQEGCYHMAASVGFSPEFREHHAKNPTLPGRGTVTGRVAVEHRVVHIEDAAADPEYTATQSQQLGLTRTMLGVPLLREDKVTGVITLSRSRVEPFTNRQIGLVTTFADQAVIAIENARLLTETREALEQQTATAEVLQVINSSPGDLAPVFDAMLDKATQLCEAEISVLWTYNGDHMEASAILGAPPRYAEFLRQGPRPLSPTHLRLQQGEPVIQIVDVPSYEGYLQGLPLARALFDLGGVRTILMVPLRKEEAVLGAFAVYRREVRPFSDREIALLQNFAAQAVIAMENARLITETREALEQQTATAEVLQVINSSPGDLTPVFDAMLEKALQLCDASFGNLITYDGECFHWRASRGHPEFDQWARRTGPLRPGSGTTMKRIVQGERIVHVVDIADDAAYRAGDPTRAPSSKSAASTRFSGLPSARMMRC